MIQFDRILKTGAGLACLHWGVEAPKEPLGKGMLNWMGGYYEAHWSVNPHWKAKFETFPKHEAANGLKPLRTCRREAAGATGSDSYGLGRPLGRPLRASLESVGGASTLAWMSCGRFWVIQGRASAGAERFQARATSA